MDLNEIYLPLFQSNLRYNILYGGSGSGKSVAVVQNLLVKLMERDNYNVLVMRKYGTDIRESVFKEIKSAISRCGFDAYFKSTTQPFKITCTLNGNEFIFRGLDDSEKLKSISGINAIWMEEVSEFDADDFHEANRRLRSAGPHPDQLFLSFNPTEETSWLKTTFFDTPNAFEDDLLILHSTYKDNKWCGKDAAKVYSTMPESQRRVYELGEWGRVSSDGLFYGQFNTMHHASDALQVDPLLPLFLSFDFNVLPSVTCLVTQQPDEHTIHVIEEIMLPAPSNNTRYVCLEILKRYRTHASGVIVTGDASGRNSSSAHEADHNNYSIIQKELAPLKPRLNVPTANPAHIPRGQFINAIFGENYGGLKLVVSRSCKALLEDLNNQPQDPNGKKVKGKVTKHGKTMEKWGHASDAFDYQVIRLWPQQFDEFQRGAKKVAYKFARPQVSAKFAL